MAERFRFWQKLIYTCFDLIIWFDKKVQYGYLDMTGDIKVQDHFKFYATKTIVKTISIE